MDRWRDLFDRGAIRWVDELAVWAGDPEDITRALREEGFAECRREIVRSRRDGGPAGGLWQGLNQRTGAVASAVWIAGARAGANLVFVDVDGVPLRTGRLPGSLGDSTSQ